jgi:hypothetical protein
LLRNSSRRISGTDAANLVAAGSYRGESIAKFADLLNCLNFAGCNVDQ